MRGLAVVFTNVMEMWLENEFDRSGDPLETRDTSRVLTVMICVRSASNNIEVSHFQHACEISVSGANGKRARKLRIPHTRSSIIVSPSL